ncbi:hypothetical protein CHELA20_51006 [Hyphomicrobiales bacterium]|nr:hypothetical protein CHELA20_51006 [Hyphomicrobiales bacterium]CAH1674730.1 hypothetical protein CHELA41_24006 [Hyphomicrobiales bacterium]
MRHDAWRVALNRAPATVAGRAISSESRFDVRSFLDPDYQPPAGSPLPRGGIRPHLEGVVA